MSMFLGTAFALTAAGLQPPPAAAPAPAPNVVSSLLECRRIADPAQRLACFDSASAAFDQARTNRDIVVVDREEVRNTRRSLFGFRLPNLFGSGADDRTSGEPPLDEVTSTVQSFRSAGYGRYAMTLADGSEWTMIESDDDVELSRGDTVKIERAAFGSYRASIGGRRAVRVRRTG